MKKISERNLKTMLKYTFDDLMRFRKPGNSYIACQSGDYTSICNFSIVGLPLHFDDDCIFANGTVFGHNNIFGKCCKFGAACQFGYECIFGCCSEFGKHCRFEQSCIFGSYSIFDDFCEFGILQEFYGSIFGDGCKFAGHSYFRKNIEFGDFCEIGNSNFLGINTSFGEGCKILHRYLQKIFGIQYFA